MQTNKQKSKSMILSSKNCQNQEKFGEICGDIRVQDQGYSIEKDDWFGFSQALGQRDYLNGRHQIRFRIEKLRRNGWMFFGIISKFESMNINSFSCLSSYGWATQNRIYLAGECLQKDNDDIINNDIFILTIDCEQRKIQMKNQLTGHIDEILVDINKCPFPWKLHFNLLNGCTSIRLLPTTT